MSEAVQQNAHERWGGAPGEVGVKRDRDETNVIATVNHVAKEKENERPAAKKRMINDQGEIILGELSKYRHVKVKKYGGHVLVDIREYYDKDGKLLPGKKGISLTKDQFGELVKMFDDIKEAMAEIETN